MKTTIFALCVLCLLCATSAFGQSASILSNTPQVTQMVEHPEHASVHAMAQETTLLGPNPYSYAKGEQPLSEYGSSPMYETPLGDVARAYRKQHAITTAKAVKSLEK
ncbi:MAG: hypothetical protein WAM78_08265 [Candidatus Sulfotelmatobacter sp.]